MPFSIDAVAADIMGTAVLCGRWRFASVFVFVTTVSNLESRWHRLFFGRQLVLRPRIVESATLYPPILYCRSISTGDMILCSESFHHDLGHLCRLASLPPEVLVEIFAWIQRNLEIVPDAEVLQNLPPIYDFDEGTAQIRDSWETIRSNTEANLRRSLREDEQTLLRDNLPELWGKLRLFFSSVERLGEIEWWSSARKLEQMETQLKSVLGDRFDERLKKLLRIRFVRAQMRFYLRPICEDYIVGF